KVNLKDVILPDYNPRKIDKETFEKLKKSLEEFGYVEPIIVNKRNMHVVGGNQRVKALKELGVEEAEAVIVDLDEKQEKTLNIALNKITGEWDFEKLEAVLKEIEDNVELTGFSEKELNKLFVDIEKASPYTYKVDAVQYEPKGEAKLEELVEKEKYMELLEKIEKADCDEEMKEFLKLAATRFLKFNFAKIADFYAEADIEVQKMFEELALVIVDFEDAIAKGFVRFSQRVAELYGEDYEEE
ncbi:MAG TPA: ParB N-terminal domain-containing protein, partial [Candidatus Pacearchaeota archaeon]|nr:ParB N-terminal domain-containing protein [Candidatus Pacearchaeota archaeon]